MVVAVWRIIITIAPMSGMVTMTGTAIWLPVPAVMILIITLRVSMVAGATIVVMVTITALARAIPAIIPGVNLW